MAGLFENQLLTTCEVSTRRCLNGRDRCLRLHTACSARLLLEAQPANCFPSPPILPRAHLAQLASAQLGLGCTAAQLRSALRDQLRHAKLSKSSLLGSPLHWSYLSKTFCSWAVWAWIVQTLCFFVFFVFSKVFVACLFEGFVFVCCSYGFIGFVSLRTKTRWFY